MGKMNVSAEDEKKTLSELTLDIVNARSVFRSKFALQEQELKKMKKVVDTISSNSESELWTKVVSESSAQSEWTEIINFFNAFSLRLTNFMSEPGPFYLAKSRADREYVNVGSVGVTQEGKSEFNASIANLDQRILPRGGGDNSCTTARINIINGASPDGKTNIVRVHYYSVKDFANLLYSHLQELGAKKEEFKELCSIETKKELTKWATDNKSEIEKSPLIGQDKLSGQKIAFLKYLQFLDKYIDRLGSDNDDYTFDELTGGKNKEKAEKYYSSVSYFSNPDDTVVKYTSYATEKAEVFSCFKIGNEDPINNLQFLDTPGIGEDKPGLERILAQSVSSDLDIIMVIRAARSDVQGDPTRSQLIPQLRALLNKRPHSQQSLYFILNVWNQAKEGTGENEREKVKDQLKIVQNHDKIVLDDSHFKIINILKGIEILPNGKTNSDNPIHNYLLTIFKQLIPNIEAIDKEFFEDAEKEYEEISKDFLKLKSLIASVSYKLPSDDLSKQIDDVLANAATKWKNTCGEISDKKIIGEIKYDLETFCNQPTGSILCEVLDIKNLKGIADFDEEEDNYEFIQNFCKENETEINVNIDRGAYEAGAELKSYAELKSKLLKKIEDNIFLCINVEKAQEELDKAKDKLADVFRTYGKLNFVSENSRIWWKAMAELLESEKYPEELTDLFKNFASFSIDYHKILKDSISNIIRESRHADNFGIPNQYFFTNYEDAKRTIIHSLLCVEKRVQLLVEEDVYKDELAKVVSAVYTHINQLRELNTFGDQNKKTELRKLWELFYKKHAGEIFADNDNERKRALISDWNKLND